jgi:hypothetical protein
VALRHHQHRKTHLTATYHKLGIDGQDDLTSASLRST